VVTNVVHIQQTTTWLAPTVMNQDNREVDMNKELKYRLYYLKRSWNSLVASGKFLWMAFGLQKKFLNP